jgi:hypothetical protein
MLSTPGVNRSRTPVGATLLGDAITVMMCGSGGMAIRA